MSYSIMKTGTNIISISFIIYLLITSCHPKPKLYEAEMMEASGAAGHVHDDSEMPAVEGHAHEHTVMVQEVLHTDKYSYLNVTEKGEKYWIAIPRTEVEIGGTYFYSGGLLKRNFESKEYDRIFETIYLVSGIHNHSVESGTGTANNAHDHSANAHGNVEVQAAEGSISLSELFEDRLKYKGKVVQVTGQCVKVNPMIMGRNWVHIQDGSGEGLDLTVTTSENVALNEVVSLEGVIALNKDFGAGYKYDIIMEQARVK